VAVQYCTATAQFPRSPLWLLPSGGPRCQCWDQCLGSAVDGHWHSHKSHPDKVRSAAVGLIRLIAHPTFAMVTAEAASELVGFAYGLALKPDTQWWSGMTEPLPDELTAEWSGRTFAIIDLAVLAATVPVAHASASDCAVQTLTASSTSCSLTPKVASISGRWTLPAESEPTNLVRKFCMRSRCHYRGRDCSGWCVNRSAGTVVIKAP